MYDLHRPVAHVMSTFLLSDLHLETDKPDLVAILLRFLRGPARQAKAVYLLGDIFEVWIGDDDPSKLVADLAKELRLLSYNGVAIYYMAGNRDFLLGKSYADRAGMTIIEDPTVADIGGVRTVLGHGDLYCTDDLAYQAFRAKSRAPEWQRMVLGWPLWRRRLTARFARYLSKRNYRKKLMKGGDPNQIADVSQDAIAASMREHGAQRMIHGHTHRPAEHQVPVDGNVLERIVLADWRESGEALEVREDGTYVRHVLV